MADPVKRYKPKGGTLRELFLKSGNLCAFPNCGELMMNADGAFIGQVCHIEGAEEGGERFNPQMTNEERREISNLMLMCYPHHVITNDVEMYTVERLKSIKAAHENRFSHPDRAMLETLKDWTDDNSPQVATNLERINEVLKWDLYSEQLTHSTKELQGYISVLTRVPMALRSFIGAVAKRIYKMEDLGVVESSMSGVSILLSDLRGALCISEESLVDRAHELEAYGLGYLATIDNGAEDLLALRLRNLKSGWRIWIDLAEFSEKSFVPMETFTEELDFSVLDNKQ